MSSTKVVFPPETVLRFSGFCPTFIVLDRQSNTVREDQNIEFISKHKIHHVMLAKNSKRWEKVKTSDFSSFQSLDETLQQNTTLLLLMGERQTHTNTHDNTPLQETDGVIWQRLGLFVWSSDIALCFFLFIRNITHCQMWHGLESSEESSRRRRREVSVRSAFTRVSFSVSGYSARWHVELCSESLYVCMW